MSDPYKAYLASREWAEKREAVRKRADNRCERCRTAEMQAVHHLTYERVGAELLTDLMAICHPCHAFLSAKNEIDPMTDGVRVYLAGPITGTRWRDDLLVGDRNVFPSQTKRGADKNGLTDDIAWSGDSIWPAVPRGLKGGFDFTGPWFEDLTAGHGRGECREGPHGWVERDREHDRLETRAYVADACRTAIDESNIVFCWIPPDSAPYGTIWELGYAAAREKTIIVAQHTTTPDDWWLAGAHADCWYTSKTAAGAWDSFLVTWQESSGLRERTHRRMKSTISSRRAVR